MSCCRPSLGVKKICNGIKYTPKGEPGYIGIGCNEATIGAPEITLEGNRREPGFCQSNCNALGQKILITNVNEDRKEVECDCPSGRKWFKINNRQTWPYQCYTNIGDTPYDPTKGEYCLNGQIHVNPLSEPMLCNGKVYDYTTQYCKDNVIYKKPEPKADNWYEQAYQIPKP